MKIRQDRKKKLPYGYFDDDQGNAQGNSKYDRQEARFQDSYQDDYVTEDFDMEVPRRLKRRDSGDILRRSKRNKTQPQQPEQQQQEDTYDYGMFYLLNVHPRTCSSHEHAHVYARLRKLICTQIRTQIPTHV